MRLPIRKLRNGLLAGPSLALCARWPAVRALRAMRRVNGIQLSALELRAIARVVKRRAPWRFLVFGCGNDARFWMRLNAGGEAVFLEDLDAWARAMARNRGIIIHMVTCGTRRDQWRALLDGPEPALSLALPGAVRDRCWDVLLVDAPAGWSDATPGRTQSIATAARLAAPDAEVFVHDCDREVERSYCDRFLGRSRLVAEVGRLRHYAMAGRAG